VGALLDAKAVEPGRTARNHLRALALSNGIPLSRVEEVLDITGIEKAADRRVGGFSLGMSQRLGIAAALLGDPGTLLFDEPVNGLDPEGIRWVRSLFRSLADEGRTVLVSSHLMSEMALTADEIIVIGRGEFITRGTVESLTAREGGTVYVRSSDFATLRRVLEAQGGKVSENGDDGLTVAGLDATTIGRVALEQGIALSELTPQRITLEEVFMGLTQESVEYEGRTQP
jgi:ABC-2 type transport system ATP-binding protein